MKKILAMLCGALAMIASTANAQGLGIANHLGVDVGVGTTGISVEASTPITRFVQARLGVSIMPGINFHVDSDVSYETPMGEQYTNIDVDGSLKRVQGSLIFNVYPLGNRFPLFIAVGGYLGGKDVVGIKGYAPEVAGMDKAAIEIGNFRLPLDETGHAKGALRVNNFRPYIGIGTGRPCPLGRVNFMWELGLQFQKKPYLYDDINKEKIDVASVLDDDTFQKIMDKLTVYPVLKFTISGRIF